LPRFDERTRYWSISHKMFSTKYETCIKQENVTHVQEKDHPCIRIKENYDNDSSVNDEQ
jgi:hypothetical protein